jgi:hypothetical protein
MCCGGCGDPLARRPQERHDAASGEIDMQIHQFLRCGALTGREHVHFVRQMEALAVGAENLRRDPHAIANQELAFVEIMRLGREGAVIGPVLV